MSSLTFTEARDEVMELIVNAWTALGAVTENIPIFFADKLESGLTSAPSHRPDAEAPWGLLRIAWGVGKQAAFGDTEKLWTRRASLIVTISTKPGDGQVLMDQIIQTVADAVEGRSTPGGVRFLSFDPNNRSNSSGDNEKNILIPFEFDQRK